MGRFDWRRGACALALIGLAATGCAQQVAGVGEYSAELSDVPDAKLNIKGLDGDKPTEVDVIAGNAIADIEDFWTDELPKVYDKDYKPLPKGNLFSVDPDGDVSGLPCGAESDDIRNNAFYCPPDDAVAWDRKELFPTLRENFGDFLIAMVLAHEWGHVIQGRVGDSGTKTIVAETQADCFAGAWTKATQAHPEGWHFVADAQIMDSALAGYLMFRDPVGADPSDQQAHGNGFDRISGFQEGFEQGAEHCTGFNDDRQFTEIPFTNETDANQGGNLPYDDAMDLGKRELDAYWKDAYPKIFDGSWEDIAAVTPYDGKDNRPKCGSEQVDRAVQYCEDDNTIYFDNADAFPAVYKKTGDFGPMTLLSMAYSQAALKQAGKAFTGGDGVKAAICLAGAHAGEVTRNPPVNQDGRISLSPGDLDEAIQALLSYAGAYFRVQTTAGFTRVVSYRDGFATADNCEA